MIKNWEYLVREHVVRVVVKCGSVTTVPYVRDLGIQVGGKHLEVAVFFIG